MENIEPHAHLRAAFAAGCRIQAWTLCNGAVGSSDGYWRTLEPRDSEPAFTCQPHLYRPHPEDLALLPTEPAPDPECGWHQEDECSDTWSTDCGHAFTLNDGRPSDNNLSHCGFCGKRLAEHVWVDEYADEDAARQEQA